MLKSLPPGQDQEEEARKRTELFAGTQSTSNAGAADSRLSANSDSGGAGVSVPRNPSIPSSATGLRQQTSLEERVSDADAERFFDTAAAASNAASSSSSSSSSRKQLVPLPLNSQQQQQQQQQSSSSPPSAAGVGSQRQSIEEVQEVIADVVDKSVNVTGAELNKLISQAVAEHPDMKAALLQHELNTFKTTLEQMKRDKQITQLELDKFNKELSEKGLEIENMGPAEETTKFMGINKRVTKELWQQLENAEIKIPHGVMAARLKASASNNIGAMVKLRDYVISRTGRENGPDIALKVIPSIRDDNFMAVRDIINENSSITEVMNVLAFLLNNNLQRDDSIVKEFSIESGAHNNEGKYISPNDLGNKAAGDLNTVFASLTGGEEPFNINTLKVYTASSSTVGALPPDTITLPQGILKRDPTTYNSLQPIPIKRNNIPLLFSACVLQMINILENTRQVFGGWAKLFKGMQGGGPKSKSKTKKTRRRNRRRY